MRILFFCFLTSLAFAQTSPSPYTPWKTEPFNANQLKGNSSFFNTNRLSMQQSYSMSYVSGPNGSMSTGMYLNRISMALSSNLNLYTDIGFQNIFYSQFSDNRLGMDNRGLNDLGAPEFIIPAVGLEYRPSDSFSLTLQMVNMNSDYYGVSPYSPYYGYSRQSPFNSPFSTDRVRSRLRNE